VRSAFRPKDRGQSPNEPLSPLSFFYLSLCHFPQSFPSFVLTREADRYWKRGRFHEIPTPVLGHSRGRFELVCIVFFSPAGAYRLQLIFCLL